jgi:DNA polymerase I
MPIPRPVDATSHLYLVDASGYIFRAYHALPPLTRKSDGLPVGAVSGFCNMLWKLLEDLKAGERPTHFACVFDKSAITFRNALYDQYKAQRPEPPEDLRPQFPLVRRATLAFGAPALEMQGFEADDLIATYSRSAAALGARVTIVSNDKDLMQLVTDRISLYDSMKDRRLGAAEVIEKFGVPPEKVVDVQALCGDSVDNVPGVPGIGIKTAAQLILEYGDLDTLLARSSEIKQPKRRESLIEHAEKARLSRTLVTLRDDAPVPEPLEDLGVRDPDPGPLLAFLQEMEFRSLFKRVSETLDGAPTLAPTLPANGGAPSPSVSPPGPGEPPPARGPMAPETLPFDLEAYGPGRGLCGRYRDHRPRPPPGEARRRLARGGPGPGLLHPPRPRLEGGPSLG